MAVQWSNSVRDAMANAIPAAIGASAKLVLFSGAVPANCAAADPAGKLVEFDLPANWASAAANGAIDLLGVPLVATATGTGTAASYRIYANDGVTCHEQGTVTLTGGGGDIEIDNTSLRAGQGAAINSIVKTAPGA